MKRRKICGARNRRGLPCQCKLLLRGERCRFHGGLSTGPKTPKGKACALAALQNGHKRWREGLLGPTRNRIGGCDRDPLTHDHSALAPAEQ